MCLCGPVQEADKTAIENNCRLHLPKIVLIITSSDYAAPSLPLTSVLLLYMYIISMVTKKSLTSHDHSLWKRSGLNVSFCHPNLSQKTGDTIWLTAYIFTKSIAKYGSMLKQADI